MPPNEPTHRLQYVIQVLPYDGIGGVEIAAASVRPGRYRDIRFNKVFLASKSCETPVDGGIGTGIRSENDPRAYVLALKRLLSENPDAIILSLWRSCVVGLLFKILRPRTRLVLFLHNNINAHFLDGIVTWLTKTVATEIWADSRSTAQSRWPSSRREIRTIYFLTDRLAAVTSERPKHNFIFWGRLHRRKRIAASLEFFSRVHCSRPDARFTIIGPDCGEEFALREQVDRLELSDAVRFFGPADRGQIIAESADASFFLQTSAAEGMAMATVEAMQLGLVPVVTPVGEIARYVEDGRNGLFFRNGEQAKEAVDTLINNPADFAAMRRAAIDQWHGRPLYRDSFIEACRQLFV